MKKELKLSYHGTIESIYKRLSKEDKEILDTYLRKRRTKASEDKVKSYRSKLLILRDLIETPFKKFNNKELIDNLTILINSSEREKAGKNELKKVLKHFLKTQFRNIELIEDIKLEKDFNEKKFNSDSLITPDEAKKLIKACKNLKERAMIVLQLELGLRPQEILSLKWNNFKFNEDHGEVQVYANKTNRTRTLPFKESLIHILRWRDDFQFNNRKQDDFVFPNPKDREKTLYKQYMSMLFRSLCKRANLRPITPYLVRHSVLSSVYKKSKDSRLTAKYGGHSLKTSEVYVNLNEEDIKEIILEQIYNIKEPDIKTRRKLEKEISELKKDNEQLKKAFKQIYEKLLPKEELEFDY